MLKPEMMLCVMMLPLVVVKISRAVCQPRAKPPRLRREIMQPPPDWQTIAERDYFTLRERG